MTLYNCKVNLGRIKFIRFDQNEVLCSVTDLNGNKVVKIVEDGDMYNSIKGLSQAITYCDNCLYYILQYDASDDSDFIMYRLSNGCNESL